MPRLRPRTYRRIRFLWNMLVPAWPIGGVLVGAYGLSERDIVLGFIVGMLTATSWFLLGLAVLPDISFRRRDGTSDR